MVNFLISEKMYLLSILSYYFEYTCNKIVYFKCIDYKIILNFKRIYSEKLQKQN